MALASDDDFLLVDNITMVGLSPTHQLGKRKRSFRSSDSSLTSLSCEQSSSSDDSDDSSSESSNGAITLCTPIAPRFHLYRDDLDEIASVRAVLPRAFLSIFLVSTFLLAVILSFEPSFMRSNVPSNSIAVKGDMTAVVFKASYCLSEHKPYTLCFINDILGQDSL